jgi:hypothetical protein
LFGLLVLLMVTLSLWGDTCNAVTVTLNFNDPSSSSYTKSTNTNSSGGSSGPLHRAFTRVRHHYEALPKEAKAATGVVAGYAGAKVVIGSATTALKVAGTVFVVSEVLHFSGALKDKGGQGWNLNSQQHKDTMAQVQSSMKQVVRDCRTHVHRAFNPNKCRQRFSRYVQKDKYGPAGLAAGIIIGLA